MLREDLFIIGNIEPDEDDLLSFSDFDRMFRIIQKHATFRVCQELEADAEERIKLLDREGLLGGQSAQYR